MLYYDAVDRKAFDEIELNNWPITHAKSVFYATASYTKLAGIVVARLFPAGHYHFQYKRLR